MEEFACTQFFIANDVIQRHREDHAGLNQTIVPERRKRRQKMPSLPWQSSRTTGAMIILTSLPCYRGAHHSSG